MDRNALKTETNVNWSCIPSVICDERTRKVFCFLPQETFAAAITLQYDNLCCCSSFKLAWNGLIKNIHHTIIHQNLYFIFQFIKYLRQYAHSHWSIGVFFWMRVCKHGFDVTLSEFPRHNLKPFQSRCKTRKVI